MQRYGKTTKRLDVIANDSTTYLLLIDVADGISSSTWSTELSATNYYSPDSETPPVKFVMYSETVNTKVLCLYDQAPAFWHIHCLLKPSNQTSFSFT